MRTSIIFFLLPLCCISNTILHPRNQAIRQLHSYQTSIVSTIRSPHMEHKNTSTHLRKSALTASTKESPFLQKQGVAQTSSIVKLVNALYTNPDKANLYLNDSKPGEFRGFVSSEPMDDDIVSNTFDIYVVSLDRQKNRLVLLDAIMQENRLRYQVVHAVDGQDLISIELGQKKGLFTKPNPSKGEYSGMYSRGAAGCTLSHLKAFQYASQSTKKYTIIFEDDITPPPYFYAQLKYLASYIDKYKPDYLYLGANSPFMYRYSQTAGHKSVLPMFQVPYSESIGRGAFAYLIANKSASSLLVKSFQPPLVPADWFPYRQYKNFKIMTLNPLWFSAAQTRSENADEQSSWDV